MKSIGFPAPVMPTSFATGMFTADRMLRGAATLWLCAALFGQFFFYYIASFYLPSTWSGSFENRNRLKALGATPYIAGDVAGNMVFLGHALGAGIVALGGALQLIPWLRTHAPTFHRWNGRVFLATVVILSLSGFYLAWIRLEPPQTLTELSPSINGVLILLFATLTLRTALARRFATHRRWALRLYLVSNAQWFLRIGVFGYFVVNQLLGREASFSDPFFISGHSAVTWCRSRCWKSTCAPKKARVRSQKPCSPEGW